MKKTIGVVLSGCGFLDGSEIHEATLTLLALDQRGAEVRAFAPDVEQRDVIDHLRGEPVSGAPRHVLVEASRITRGKIASLASAHAADLDAVIFPGGYGAAKNLSSFAVDGPRLTVHPEVARLIREVHEAGKPLGFICIAPVLAAKVLGAEHPQLTIGHDADTAKALEALGARHVDREVDQIVVDERLKIVSTPAYMLGPSIAPVAAGISRLVQAVLEMC